jgi:hypothetical protein
MFPTLVKILDRRKKLELRKSRTVALAFKHNQKCPRYLPEVTLSALAQFTRLAALR